MKKLTLVSLKARGSTIAAFLMLPVTEEGKVQVSEEKLFRLFEDQTGKIVPRGATFSIGA